jgi:DNA-binding XRE family transcriptional regulator
MSLINTVTIGTMPDVKPETLKEWRERLGLSQEQLAEKLKVARNTINRWENGKRAIPEFLELALKTVERELPDNPSS